MLNFDMLNSSKCDVFDLKNVVKKSYMYTQFAKNNVREIDRNYLILTINKWLFTMKVENHATTKLGNEHENLLKTEIQRMWTNIKLCLKTYVHMYYSFLIQQLLYVCYAYLLQVITKLLKILIFAHGEHKKKLIRIYSILFYIRIHS